VFEGNVTSASNHATFCMFTLSKRYAAFFDDSPICCGIRGKMKLLDVCVIALVSVVYLSRLPSPLRSLKSDLVAKNSLTVLSSVCQLVGVLVACDYFETRQSPAGANHLGWIAAEIAGWISAGFLLGPACRFFLSNLFSKKSVENGASKVTLSPIKFRPTRWPPRLTR
jgi:hypothetical protein